MSQPATTWATQATIVSIIADIELRLRAEPDMGYRGVVLNSERNRWEQISRRIAAWSEGSNVPPPHDPMLTQLQVDRVLANLETIHRRLKAEAQAAVAA